MSQDAILLRAEAGDRLARSEIEEARAELDGERLGIRNDPPTISENAREVLAEVGYSAVQIDSLMERGVVTSPD